MNELPSAGNGVRSRAIVQIANATQRAARLHEISQPAVRGVSMRVIRIEQFDDPRLHDYRKVSDGEILRRRNLFVAEGRLVVGRLLEDGHRVESMLLNDG